MFISTNKATKYALGLSLSSFTGVESFSPYSVWMWENKYQKNSEYGRLLGTTKNGRSWNTNIVRNCGCSIRNSRLAIGTLIWKIMNQEREYKKDSKVKEIINKMTGMRHQRHLDILKNIKSKIIRTSTAIKQHKPKVSSFSLDIISTARRQL